ncbi:hypothetical protein CB0940_06627 [Cercospora beticola]|uniref:Histone chaperone domain-containing protein n=1 Tax=Cercospora beticola TaxID=122368 RepID=A0A2G5I0B4_CERBT|nr:hypothetical protein CB0940_06627 [Cercospora beticola]PIA98210.1 hypothetical protein CB0940_06627 [Cercospora beticola]WPA99280.1 hypothetical protein RHO25_003897 [Cercospora beticola]
MSSSADEQYEQQNDQISGDAPAGDAQDNDYASRTGQNQYGIPVVKDDAAVEEGGYGENADSDAQLEKDDRDVDESNILDSRTRGAAKQKGTYAEPGDEEGLPGPEDGTSSGRQ